MSKQAKKLRSMVSVLLAAFMAASCFSVSAAAAEKTNPDVSAVACANYISDTAGWGKMNIYAWDADGTPLCGEWPGIALYDKTEDEYGYDMYLYSIPEGAYGIILSDSFDGNQTVEITDLSVDHYYITGERDPKTGHFYVSDSFNSEAEDPYLYGDVDLDGSVSISDATKISFSLAQFEGCELTELQETLADVDGNGTVSIADATTIQFYLADLGGSGRTGQKYVVPEYESTFILTDNLRWGTAYLFAWDEDGNALCGEWPGTAIEETQTNVFGENEFIVNVPKGACGVFISNGRDSLTEDITDFSYDHYWLSGEQDDLGHYLVSTPAPCKDFCNIDFVNSVGWENVYIYSQGITDSWPGTAMSKVDGTENTYRASYPMWELGQLITFNNGLGDETVYAHAQEDGVYRTNGERNSDNDLIIYPNAGIEKEKTTISFIDTQIWGNVNIFAWDAEGNSLLGEWPGTAMTYEGVNDFGEPYYTAEIPKDAVGIVFNSGAGNDQTEDLSPTPNAEYLSTGQRNENGHLIVFANLKSMDNIL